MEAGSDTTAVFLQSFVSFMVAFPDVQKRAQKELDDVVGTVRSPTFDDWESLPYIQAIIKEVHFCPIRVSHTLNKAYRTDSSLSAHYSSTGAT